MVQDPHDYVIKVNTMDLLIAMFIMDPPYTNMHPSLVNNHIYMSTFFDCLNYIRTKPRAECVNDQCHAGYHMRTNTYKLYNLPNVLTFDLQWDWATYELEKGYPSAHTILRTMISIPETMKASNIFDLADNLP